MNFNQFVFRNTLRNKHTYLAYFLSTTMSVMTFFAFTALANHPKLSSGLDSRVDTGMNIAAGIIYLFSFFFVLYSMDIFVQSRKREFGTLMIQGMSFKQLKKMIFIENLVIGFFATIVGSLFGIGFSQLVLLFSNNVMHLDFPFYFPAKALMVTAISFVVLFLLTSFFMQFRIPRYTLQELLKAGDLGKGKIKFSPIQAIIGIILIGIGYTLALTLRAQAVVMVMLPVIVLVILGTSLLFNQASIMVIEAMKKRTNFFWKKTNLVVLSDLAFRMKDNARSFFLVSIISTVAFAAIGTLYGVQNLLVGGIESAPYEYIMNGTPEEITGKAAEFQKRLDQDKVKADTAIVTTYSYKGQEMITEADYNKLAKINDIEKVSVDKSAVYVEQTTFDVQSQSEKTLDINGQKFPVSQKIKADVTASGSGLYVVPNDTNFAETAAAGMAVWEPKGLSEDQMIKIGSEQPEGSMMAKSFLVRTILDMYAPILFVGIFIGIVFFVSAGSFLYFRLYSDINLDIEKFKMIYKVGLTKKELKKMVSQQVGILFFTPIVVSMIHGIVALTAMYHIFELNMQATGWIVLGVFLLIQVIYYLFARHFYFKKIYAGIVA